jgi:hypothetical protein
MGSNNVEGVVMVSVPEPNEVDGLSLRLLIEFDN